MPGAFADQHPAIDQQCGIVDAARGQTDALRDPDRHQAAQRGVGQGVQDQQTAGAQEPAGFRHRDGEVVDVFEDLAGNDHVRAPVGQRHGEHVGPYRVDAVCGCLAQAGCREVDADVVVAVDVWREQARTAAEVDENRTGPWCRDQLGACGGQPVQHDERTARSPPLVGESLVQLGVVRLKIVLRAARQLADWRSMGRTEALARSCHPLPALAVTVVAAALAITTGRSAGGVVAVASAVLAGQLSVGWLNDLLDAGRDARVGRRDKPVASGAVSPKLVAIATIVAAGAAVLLSLLSGVDATLVHVVMLCSAWAYDFGLKATAFSVVPYAVSFGLLPAFVTLGGPGGRWAPLWLVLAAAVLGSAAHFANVIPDLEDDAATGVRGLPHRVGKAASAGVAAALAVITGVVLAVGPPGPVTMAGLVAVPLSVMILVIGGVRGRRAGSRANFNALLAVAVVDVALLIITGGVEL